MTTVNELLAISHNMYKSAICLDVSKGFDKVWNEVLIFKLRKFDLATTLISPLENYLTDRS